MGTQVKAETDCPDLYVTAAINGEGTVAVLVSYFNDDAKWNQAPPPDAEIRFEIPGAKDRIAFVVDDERTSDPVQLKDDVLRMKGNTCALVFFRR